MRVRIAEYGVVEVVQFVALPGHPDDRPEALVHVKALPGDDGISDIVWKVEEAGSGPTGMLYFNAYRGAYYRDAATARAEFDRRKGMSLV